MALLQIRQHLGIVARTEYFQLDLGKWPNFSRIWGNGHISARFGEMAIFQLELGKWPYFSRSWENGGTSAGFGKLPYFSQIWEMAGL